jgi:hypothetical protein
MPPTPRDHTTGRFRRRYDPLQTEAAFDDALGEADQDNLGREDEELNPSMMAWPTFVTTNPTIK